jgi:uncharacterized repeat protein (TIGR03809 family)
MTERTDVARGRDIVVRWSALAEQRLDYLTELFETGRWRRYYSENDFLENIREAKGAVETWHGLLTAEATPDNRPIDFSWIGRSSAVLLPKVNVSAEPIQSIAPQLAELPVAPSVSVVPAMAEPQPEPEPVTAVETAEAFETSEALEAIAALETAEAFEVAEAIEVAEAQEIVEDPEESALDKTLALTLDIVGMAKRYPLLRNAFQQTGNRITLPDMATSRRYLPQPAMMPKAGAFSITLPITDVSAST